MARARGPRVGGFPVTPNEENGRLRRLGLTGLLLVMACPAATIEEPPDGGVDAGVLPDAGARDAGPFPLDAGMPGWVPLEPALPPGRVPVAVRVAADGLFVATENAVLRLAEGQTTWEVRDTQTFVVPAALWRMPGQVWAHLTSSVNYFLDDASSTWSVQPLFDCVTAADGQAFRVVNTNTDVSTTKRWDPLTRSWQPWASSTVNCFEADVDSMAFLGGRLLHTRHTSGPSVQRLFAATLASPRWVEVTTAPQALQGTVNWWLVSPNAVANERVWLVPMFHLGLPLFTSPDGLQWDELPSTTQALDETASLVTFAGTTWLTPGASGGTILRLTPGGWEPFPAPPLPPGATKRQLFVWEGKLCVADANGLFELRVP